MPRQRESAKARLFVVDDDGAIRRSLTEVLEAAAFQVESFSSAVDLLAAFGAGRTAQCIIADVRMPEMSGLELLKALAERHIIVPVVLITGHGDIPMAVKAMKAGAVDFIEKPFDVDEIVRAASAATGQACDVADDAARSEFQRRFGSLTPRERQTLDLIVVGHTNKSAAHRLSISPRTVEVHRAKIMEKMGARSLAELVRMSLMMDR